MSIDPSVVQRLSQSIALAIEQALAPLQHELESLRAAVAALRTAAGQGATVAPPSSADRPKAVAIAAAGRGRKPRTATRGLACLVPGCSAAVLAKDLCETHYRIMRRLAAAGQKFDPRVQRPSGAHTGTRGCREPDCREPHYAKGLCRRHYMAVRARARTEESRRGGRGAAVVRTEPSASEPPEPARPAPEAAAVEAQPSFALTFGDTSEFDGTVMPTREMVARVIRENQGNIARVAQALRRPRRNTWEVIHRLGLGDLTEQIRKAAIERIKAAPLAARLGELLTREMFLEDYGILKEIDEGARHEVLDLCAHFARPGATEDEVLHQLGTRLGLDVTRLRRLQKRFNLRQQLRGVKSHPTGRPRARI